MKLRLKKRKRFKHKKISLSWTRGRLFGSMNGARKRISFKLLNEELPFAWVSLGKIAVIAATSR